MPVVTVVKAGGDLTAATNRNLLTLLGAAAPLSGWVKGLVMQTPDTNTEAAGGIKVGNSAMTSTDFDAQFGPSASYDDSPAETPVFLGSRYVRTDEATDQSLIIRFEAT